MSQSKLDRLETIVDRLDEDEVVSGDELREIAEDLETGKKYECATCEMYCTGEEIMVIYNHETEEFIQIEVPMMESDEITVMRVA
jgi:Pyruvate/2-oxoacid:ferredoxin oxidoreductase delta subunit